MNSMYFSNEQLDWLKHFLSFLFLIKYLEIKSNTDQISSKYWNCLTFGDFKGQKHWYYCYTTIRACLCYCLFFFSWLNWICVYKQSRPILQVIHFTMALLIKNELYIIWVCIDSTYMF